MPKISTGYLTPQASKQKNPSKKRLSDAKNKKEENTYFNENAFKEIIKCPEKKNLILQLLAANRKEIEEYQKKVNKGLPGSPANKSRIKKPVCESPVALLRRRELEQMNSSPSSPTSSARSDSSKSDTCTASTNSSIPFEKILEGVIVYVEIRNRQDADKSGGAKAILKSMGAEVKDSFSSNVTHVVFKDGSYATFNKAKRLKVHLVSILWVECCRRNSRREDEKSYPALRGGFNDESLICSQMQKEYEDIVREEYRRSLLQDAPLPTSQAIIDRRRTLMTPSTSNLMTTSSFITAEELVSSQDSSDREVANINGFQSNSSVLKSLENTSSEMELTCLHSSKKSLEQKDLSSLSLNGTKGFSSVSMKSSLSSWNESMILGKNAVKPSETIGQVSSMSGLQLSKPMTSNEVSGGSSRKSLHSSKASRHLEAVLDNSDDSDIRKKIKTRSNATSMSSLQLSKPMTSNEVSEGSSRRSLHSSKASQHLEAVRDHSDDSDIRKNIKTRSNSTSMSSLQLSKPMTLNEVSGGSSRRSLKYKETSHCLEISLDNSDDSEIKSPQKKVKTHESSTSMSSLQLSKPMDLTESSSALNSSKRVLVVNLENSPLDRSVEKEKTERPRKALRKTMIPADFSKTEPSTSKKSQRKLYNKDDPINFVVDDEKEREEKRDERRKKISDESIFINPMDVLQVHNKDSSISSVDSDNSNASPPKRAVLNDSAADEQRDLLNEVLQEQKKVPEETPSRRKSMRINSSTYKPRNVLPVTPVNRRSTMDFMSKSQIASSRKKPKKKKIDKTSLPTIVCTKLHREDVQVFAQIVKKLGEFIVEDEVTDKTTHIVAGESKRTINMLRAVARGCWVLNFDWVLKSLEEGKWLPEEDFEVKDFSPVVEKCRLERQAFGPEYVMNVFESCPPIYVAPSSTPRCSDLKELITTCKGKVVTSSRMARIVVGQYLKQDDTVCVQETWVLDSITFYRKMPFKNKYTISTNRKSVCV